MRTCFTLVLALLLLASPTRAGDEPETDLNALKARVSELEAAKLGLERKVAELQTLLNKYAAEKAGEVHTMEIPLGFDGQPAPPHLKGISLPPRPTKEQVRAYVATILRAAGSHRGGYGAQDPEVGLLKKVGPDHIDVLMEPLLYAPFPNGDLYLTTALESLVTNAHKDLVLGRLQLCRQVVSIVVSRGWTQDAAPVLLTVLADHASWKPSAGGATLPHEWVEAVASLKRPESYGDLKAFFYEDGNRYQAWLAIKDLPGVLLDSDIAAVWAWAKKRNPGYERDSLAAVAAHYGHFDALEELFEDPGNWPQSAAIESVTPYRGGPFDREKARQWFQENRARLAFDAEARRYNIKE